jgi:hypothetical protein
MIKLRKGMVITEAHKRFRVTGWDADNVYASLVAGNPDVDYFAWPKSWVTLDSKGTPPLIRRTQPRAAKTTSPVQSELTRLMQNWRHNAPADL